MVVRIVKLVFLNALRVFPYSGEILLLTVIFREDNKRIDGGIPCNTIHGTQFLVVSLAFGVCHILGKLSGYTVHKLTASAIVSFILFSITTSTAVLVTLSNMDRIAVLVVCLSVVQISLSAISTEIDSLRQLLLHPVISPSGISTKTNGGFSCICCSEYLVRGALL